MISLIVVFRALRLEESHENDLVQKAFTRAKGHHTVQDRATVIGTLLGYKEGDIKILYGMVYEVINCMSVVDLRKLYATGND